MNSMMNTAKTEPEEGRLREQVTRLEIALRGVVNLFKDPSPFYIRKLGPPITNGDQEVIDGAFICAENALSRTAETPGGALPFKEACFVSKSHTLNTAQTRTEEDRLRERVLVLESVLGFLLHCHQSERPLAKETALLALSDKVATDQIRVDQVAQ